MGWTDADRIACLEAELRRAADALYEAADDLDRAERRSDASGARVAADRARAHADWTVGVQ